MIRRVEIEDRLRPGAAATPSALGHAEFVGGLISVGFGVAAEIVAAKRPGDVFVAGEDDRVERSAMHRIVLAQLVVEGVGVGSKGRVRRIEARTGRVRVAHVVVIAWVSASTTRSSSASVMTSGGQKVLVSAPTARVITPMSSMRSRIAIGSTPGF